MKIKKNAVIPSGANSVSRELIQRSEFLVLMKFRHDTPKEKKHEIINRLNFFDHSRKTGIQCVDIEYGFQNSKEGLGRQFEMGVRISFTPIRNHCCFENFSCKFCFADQKQVYNTIKNYAAPFLQEDDGLLIFNYTTDLNKECTSEGEYRVYHWGLFKFRKDITYTEKREVIRCFLNLKNSLRNEHPYIPFVEYGFVKAIYYPEFDVIFRMSFSSLADRD